MDGEREVGEGEVGEREVGKGEAGDRVRVLIRQKERGTQSFLPLDIKCMEQPSDYTHTC